MPYLKPLALLSFITLAGFGPAYAQTADKSVQPKISSLNLRLFYETNGVLSPDLPASFAAHNVIIGEGDAKEPANDVLVVVAMTVPGKEANVSLPLSIKVTNDKGKVLAQRVVKSLFFKEGKNVKTLMANDLACAGAVKIEASIGRERRTKTMTFNCGE